MTDFFISYNRDDKAWAEWIGWTLEEAKYSVVLDVWDFRPAENFVLEMHEAVKNSRKTIAVLSESYLEAVYVHAEWAAAFGDDPSGGGRKLIPVKVKECQPDGLLKPLIYVNLIGLPEEEAREVLLQSMKDRVKPERVEFPGAGSAVESSESRKFSIPQAFPSFHYKFQNLIDLKTKDFVGRKYVFDAIEQFVSTHSSGYFTIIGEPGMGKSSILARYVQSTNCIAHFNKQGEYESTDEFMRTIYGELSQRYQLPLPPLPSDPRHYASALNELLGEVARRRQGQPIVVAIDALDEVEKVAQERGANVLSLPKCLPEGVYFVMTKRRDVRIPFITDSPKRSLDLKDYEVESREDVCNYVHNRIQVSEILKRQQLQEPDFVDKIADKSQNNFMYLVYVLEDIENGRFIDLMLDRFPTGLQEYYEWHWERMGMNAEPLPETRLKVVYYLAAAYEPITLEWLSGRIPQEDPNYLQRILTEWGQFLHKKEAEKNSRQYSIYHASFRDFLYRQETLDGVKMNLGSVHSQIVDSFTRGLFDDEDE
jgi:hypothetical protein